MIKKNELLKKIQNLKEDLEYKCIDNLAVFDTEEEREKFISAFGERIAGIEKDFKALGIEAPWILASDWWNYYHYPVIHRWKNGETKIYHGDKERMEDLLIDELGDDVKLESIDSRLQDIEEFFESVKNFPEDFGEDEIEFFQNLKKELEEARKNGNDTALVCGCYVESAWVKEEAKELEYDNITWKYYENVLEITIGSIQELEDILLEG